MVDFFSQTTLFPIDFGQPVNPQTDQMILRTLSCLITYNTLYMLNCGSLDFKSLSRKATHAAQQKQRSIGTKTANSRQSRRYKGWGQRSNKKCSHRQLMFPISAQNWRRAKMAKKEQSFCLSFNLTLVVKTICS